MYMLEDTLALRSDTSTCHVCSSLYELATNRGDVYMSNAGLNFQYIVSASSIEGAHILLLMIDFWLSAF